LGAFTSFDPVTGSAQNPLTLNRFLYGNANPATMMDPDGHPTCYSGYCPSDLYEKGQWDSNAKARLAAGCPVFYCGTRVQIARNAGLDMAMERTLRAQADTTLQAAPVAGGPGSSFRVVWKPAREYFPLQDQSQLLARILMCSLSTRM
jgi:hypothetical protein